MVRGFLNSCLLFSLWLFYCLSFFDLRPLSILLASSNFFMLVKKQNKKQINQKLCISSCFIFRAFQWTRNSMKIETPRIIIILSKYINSFRLGSSLPPVVCLRAHILFTLLYLFTISDVQHILWGGGSCFWFLFFLLCTPCCRFLWIVHFRLLLSVFSNVYILPGHVYVL